MAYSISEAAAKAGCQFPNCAFMKRKDYCRQLHAMRLAGVSIKIVI